jgi:hypothetical protein
VVGNIRRKHGDSPRAPISVARTDDAGAFGAHRRDVQIRIDASAAPPPYGKVTVEGTDAQPFRGWLELLAILSAAFEPTAFEPTAVEPTAVEPSAVDGSDPPPDRLGAELDP